MDFGIWAAMLVLVKFCLYVSVFLAIGSALFLLLFREFTDKIIRHLRLTIYFSSVIGIICSVAFLLVQTGFIMEDGIAGMFDAEMLQLFLEKNIGTSLYMRIGGLLLLIFTVCFLPNSVFLTAMACLMVAASFALVGHATCDNYIYTSILVTLHLLVVSFWFAALWPLHSMASHVDAALIMEKFGKIATYAVPVLIIVGVLFAVQIVGDVSALFYSSYGNGLLAKIALVAVLLSLATLNKLIYVPQLAVNNPIAVKKLRKSIRIEGLVFVTIFAATAVLTTAMTLPE